MRLGFFSASPASAPTSLAAGISLESSPAPPQLTSWLPSCFFGAVVFARAALTEIPPVPERDVAVPARFFLPPAPVLAPAASSPPPPPSAFGRASGRASGGASGSASGGASAGASDGASGGGASSSPSASLLAGASGAAAVVPSSEAPICNQRRRNSSKLRSRAAACVGCSVGCFQSSCGVSGTTSQRMASGPSSRARRRGPKLARHTGQRNCPWPSLAPA
mmetsp:Transcript_70557/g.151158  ORF Transcript_70557/g.151158 Transcript_70557/m.151158 type:complete len:221 (-) Transcript_70557:150-812(-)